MKHKLLRSLCIIFRDVTFVEPVNYIATISSPENRFKPPARLYLRKTTPISHLIAPNLDQHDFPRLRRRYFHLNTPFSTKRCSRGNQITTTDLRFFSSVPICKQDPQHPKGITNNANASMFMVVCRMFTRTMRCAGLVVVVKLVKLTHSPSSQIRLCANMDYVYTAWVQ